MEQLKVKELEAQLAFAQQRSDLEKDELIEHIAAAHAAEHQLKEVQIKRLAEKNAKLTRHLIRE